MGRSIDTFGSAVSGQFALAGDITPSQVTADQNDYNPANLSSATILRISTDASRNITGIAGGADGRVLSVYNSGANNIILNDANAGSTALNRFAFGRDFTILPGQSTTVRYDIVLGRWTLLVPPPSSVVTTDLPQAVTLSGEVTPPQITGDQNDYNPTSLATVSALRLGSDALRNITGLQGGSTGRVLIIENVGAFSIVLKDSSTSSSAANRFLFGSDLILLPSGSVALRYDSVSSRWRAINTSVVAPLNIISTSTTAISIGRQGAINPAFNVDSSVASSVTGVGITAATAGAAARLSALSTLSNESFWIDAKGGGTIHLGSRSTGGIRLSHSQTVAIQAAATWSQNPGPATGIYGSCAWSPELGLFVATATGGTVKTSPDGINWIPRTASAAATWQGVAWAPTLGLFAAVGGSNGTSTIMTSPDGITWTTRTAPNSNNWVGLVWIPRLALFVATAVTGTGNRVMTSPDGVTWTARTSAADNNWEDVTWSPELSLIVAVANSGTGNRVMTSPDGVTWTIRSVATDRGWTGVVWAASLGLFVAVSNSGTSDSVMTSPDGITWTLRTTPTGNAWYRVAWSPELRTLAATGPVTGTTNVMTSLDGVFWGTHTTTNEAWGGIAWAPELGIFAVTSLVGNSMTSQAPTGQRGANGWTYSGPLTSLSLKQFGVFADGVRSDLAAFNKAMAYANTVGGNVSFRVPIGTTLLDGVPTPIVVGKVYFVGDGAPENCVIKSTNNAGVQWSTTSIPIDRGGMINVGLDSDGGTGRIALLLPWANRVQFDNIWLGPGLMCLATVGDPGLTSLASQITFSRCHGYVADGPLSFIQLFNGSGLWVHNCDVINAVTPGTQTAGRCFIQSSTGNWDTAMISNNVLQVFYSPLSIVAANGKVQQSFAFHGNFSDEMTYGVVTIANAGGTVYAVELENNEITANAGIGFFAQDVGLHEGYRIVSNRFLQCQAQGIVLPGTTTDFCISDNSIYDVNNPDTSSDGIEIATGATNGIVNNNQVGSTIIGGGTPRYGLSIGNVSNVIISDNILNGSTAGANFGTLTNCSRHGNLGFTNGVADASCLDNISKMSDSVVVGVGVLSVSNTHITNGDICLTLACGPTSATDTGSYLAAFFSGNFSAALGGIVRNGTNSVNYVSASDIRGKPNRELLSYEEARGVVDALRIWDFDKDGNAIRGVGAIAQEAIEVLPSMVIKGKTEEAWWMAEKAGPVPYLVRNVQELNAAMDRLTALEAEVSRMRSEFTGAVRLN